MVLAYAGKDPNPDKETLTIPDLEGLPSSSIAASINFS